jgi:uncharacterized membrane protein
MFRDPGTGSEKFLKRFDELMERLDDLENIRLDSEYLRESEAHYRALHKKLHDTDFDDRALDALREHGMSELNRLQKMKNRSAYRKEKYRNRPTRDGWE